MKLAAVIALVVVLVFLGIKIGSLWSEEKDLGAQLQDFEARFAKTQAQGADLRTDAQYLANSSNLEKELRSRFNYKKPGETMVILVPGTSSTASSTP